MEGLDGLKEIMQRCELEALLDQKRKELENANYEKKDSKIKYEILL